VGTEAGSGIPGHRLLQFCRVVGPGDRGRFGHTRLQIACLLRHSSTTKSLVGTLTEARPRMRQLGAVIHLARSMTKTAMRKNVAVYLRTG